VSAANSLIGTADDDQLGNAGVTALSNGNYVVASSVWDNGTTVDVGAATWGNGGTGTVGEVSVANSLFGTTVGDQVAGAGVTALSNGNYVVRSPSWHKGSAAGAGAATWGSGSGGTVGVVSVANSVIGTTASEQVGLGVVALGNGNYVVSNPVWDNGGDPDTGAVTWGNGNAGVSGVAAPANSLVGVDVSDRLGSFVTPLSNGNYAVRSPFVNNGRGAISLGRGSGGTLGPIMATNSVRGTASGGGASMVFAYDVARDTLVVGQPAANIVSLFRADLLFTAGFANTVPDL
jgi:hypothetical protein